MAVTVNSGDSNLDAAILKWFQWDKNASTRDEVEELVARERWDELRSRMLRRLKFGTAGLRGRMAAGVSCMNDVVVLQTAQGLCSYLKSECGSDLLKSGIVIGYDGRYNSKRFAELTAKVFTSSSVQVYLFSDTVPTPFVSFATLQLGCRAGVMVTASHNPKEDNGYKVYWSNGSQIITPHDDNILNEIERSLDIPDDHWDLTDIRSHSLVADPFDDVMTWYCDYIRSSLSERVLTQNRQHSAPAVYSAMHGVGYPAVSQAFEAANLKEPICVAEQRDANPEFPTVKFPNPEEAQCLERGHACAERQGARLLLANDPDADRLAVAEYNTERSEWKVFSGNEMGALLGWWLLQEYGRAEGGGGARDHVYLLASVVSSKLLRAVARAEGCRYVETLTGFKWMGNKTHLLKRAGKLPLFAFEEAIGYMCDARVPDKDGVSAAVQVASLATELYTRGSSLSQQLQDLYTQHGYYVSHNFYYVCHDPDVIKRIFKRIRNYNGTGTYPRQAGGLDIVSVHDLVTGVTVPNHEVPPEGSSTSPACDRTGTGLDMKYTGGEMVMLTCGNSLQVTVRTSGTEPKLKLYTEIVASAQDQKQEKENLVRMVDTLMEDLIEPKKNSLIR